MRLAYKAVPKDAGHHCSKNYSRTLGHIFSKQLQCFDPLPTGHLSCNVGIGSESF